MQSRRHSFIESLANVAIGYSINLVAQVCVFPCFGIHVTLGENFAIGGVFTVISIVRSYVLRRMFNRFHLHGSSK